MNLSMNNGSYKRKCGDIPTSSGTVGPYDKNTKEVWVKIFDGRYSVSNFGRVMTHRNSSSHKSGDILSPVLNHRGYATISINKRTYFVHRLVATAFIPNPGNLPEINHLDEVRDNNRADNLEWCNRLYNIRYGHAMARVSAALKRRPILQYSTKGDFIQEWPSARECGRELGIDQSCIVRSAEGKIRTYQKSIWLYKDDQNIQERIRDTVAWASKERNVRYGKKTPVEMLSKDNVVVKRYDGVREAEKDGFKSASICSAIKKGHSHFGYYWRYSL